MPATPSTAPSYSALAVAPHGEAIDPNRLQAVFTPREAATHKGSFGTVAVLGGAAGMTGAALLAARAALHMGAGKVLVGFTQSPSPLPCDPMQPELMCREANEVLGGGFDVTVWVVGCGAGATPYTEQVLKTLFIQRENSALVIDADALNLLASGAVTDKWVRTTPVVLTPHPAEAARLLACKAIDIQADRAGAAKALASRFSAWVVLKGAGTIVCAPTGKFVINQTGNPGLATAGTGDVLAGMIGSLIAQDLPLDQAVQGAVWLHGAAADACVAAGIGPIGLTASEIAVQARAIRNQRAYPSGK